MPFSLCFNPPPLVLQSHAPPLDFLTPPTQSHSVCQRNHLIDIENPYIKRHPSEDPYCLDIIEFEAYFLPQLNLEKAKNPLDVEGPYHYNIFF